MYQASLYYLLLFLIQYQFDFLMFLLNHFYLIYERFISKLFMMYLLRDFVYLFLWNYNYLLIFIQVFIKFLIRFLFCLCHHLILLLLFGLSWIFSLCYQPISIFFDFLSLYFCILLSQHCLRVNRWYQNDQSYHQKLFKLLNLFYNLFMLWNLLFILSFYL